MVGRCLATFSACLFVCFASAQAIVDESMLKQEMSSFEQKRGASLQSVSTPYDLRYARFEWEVNPTEYAISGKVTQVFIAQARLPQLEFELSTKLTVDSVYLHGQATSFTRFGDFGLVVLPPQAIAVGATDSVSIWYHGSPPSSGFGSFRHNQRKDSTWQIATLSQPFGTRDWWPSKISLTDKYDSIDIWVKTPQSYRLAANGLLRDSLKTDTFITWHYAHRYPIVPYLIAIAVTNYVTYREWLRTSSTDSIPVENYVFPEGLSDWSQKTALLIPQFAHLIHLFGPYPWLKEKYGHAQFDWGGGMEHQTMSFVGSNDLDLLIHELGHQWFGDQVTCGNWEDIWLNEGFATYMTGLCYEHFRGRDAWNGWKERCVDQIMRQPGGSVFCDDTTSVSRIFDSRLSYTKGAMVLHMLRHTVGDSAFFQACRNYQNDPTLKYGFAKTVDLKRHMEAVSGQNLNTFFYQWIYGQGYPIFSVRWDQDEVKTLHFTVTQQTSHPSVGNFLISIPLRAKGPAIDTLFWIDPAQTTLSFPYKIDSLWFNPENDIIAAGTTTYVGQGSGVDRIEILPNPFASQITIRSNDFNTRLTGVRLFNAAGQVCYQQAFNQSPNYQLFIDASVLSAGTYTLWIDTTVGRITRQVIKIP